MNPASRLRQTRGTSVFGLTGAVHTVAGVGDLVQARRNGWELAAGQGSSVVPINREVLRVLAATDEGGLVVEKLDGPHLGARLALPASYVAADLTLGYSSTVHSAQGRTVDTSHVVVDARTAPETLYVGMTRGRHGRHAHVVTHPVSEEQPVGAGHTTPRRDAFSVVTGILGSGRSDLDVDPDQAAVEQATDDEARRASVQTAIERFAAEAEMIYIPRTAATLDRLTTQGRLTADERLAFAQDSTGTRSLARLLRTAELAGHDPQRVLSDAVVARDFSGARSLPQVTYRRIEQMLAGRLTPEPTAYEDMVPLLARKDWEHRFRQLAAKADERRRELGARTVADAPQWAVENLGPVPTDQLGRLDWEHRAGLVAAWRELAGHTDPGDALGNPARPDKPEHYAAWRSAWMALGRPDAAREEAELSEGQLRMRVRAHAREEA